VLGQRGTGKTSFILEEIKTVKANKTLIVDTADNKLYAHIPFIKPDWLPKWKSGIKRILVTDADAVLNAVTGTLTDTQVFFEDCGAYLGRYTLDDRMYKLMIQSKQKRLTPYFVLHSWGFVYPDLLRFIDRVVLFSTKDTPASKKNYMSAYELVAAADKRCKANFTSNFHYHEIIDVS
jgi:hypothetical protein